MSTWKILEWSRERGRGAISGAHFPRIEFDASHAAVDDFVVGEVVHVDLEGRAPDLKVRRVWPDIPRFTATAARDAVPLADAPRWRAEDALQHANGWLDIRVSFGTDSVRCELDDDSFCDGARAVLEMRTLVYAEVSTVAEPAHIKLAGPAERSYLATRCDLGAEDIAVAIIDHDQRFYFVVARDIAYTSSVTPSATPTT